MDAVLGRMYAVSVSPTGGVPGPAWKQGSELSRWLSFEEGAALEDRTALKDLHVRVGRAAEAMEVRGREWGVGCGGVIGSTNQ